MIKGLSILFSWVAGVSLIAWAIADLTSWHAYPIVGGLMLIAWGGYKPLWRIIVHGGSIIDSFKDS